MRQNYLLQMHPSYWWRLVLVLLALLPGYLALAQAPAWQLAHVLAMGSDNVDFQTMAADSSGHLFVVGTFEDTLRLGAARLVSAGQADVYVAKYDVATARFVWAERLGGPGPDYASSVAVQGHSVYVAGGTRRGWVSYGSHHTPPIARPDDDNPDDLDIFVTKITDEGATGRFAWHKQAGGRGEDYATALAVRGRSVYLAGSYNRGNADFDDIQLGQYYMTTDSGLFVAKLTETGHSARFRWVQALGSPPDAYPYDGNYLGALAVRGAAVYVAGKFSQDALLVGSTLLANPDSLHQDHLFVARLTDEGATGCFEWASQATGPGDAVAAALAVRGPYVYLAGNFSGDTLTLGNTRISRPNRLMSGDVFVARLTDTGSAGHFDWAQASGGPGYDQVYGLACVGSSLYLAGRSTGPVVNFGSTTLTNYTTAGISIMGSLTGAAGDIFLAKLTDVGTAGFFEWATRTGGGGRTGAAAVVASAGRVYVAGDLLTDATLFGATLVVNNPANNYYLATVTDPVPATLAPVVLPATLAAVSALALTGGAGQLATYTLLDKVGRAVRQGTVSANTATALNTEGLSAGLYALRVQVAGVQAVRRVVVR